MRSRTVSGSRSRPANTIAYRARRSGSMPSGRGPSRPSTSVRPSAPAGLATTATTKERVASKDHSGGQPPGQPVGAARGPRQRLGLVSGLVRRLCTRASHRPSRSCHGPDACSSWRQLEQRCGAPALRVPLFPRPRLLQPQHRFPACPGPLADAHVGAPTPRSMKVFHGNRVQRGCRWRSPARSQAWCGFPRTFTVTSFIDLLRYLGLDCVCWNQEVCPPSGPLEARGVRGHKGCPRAEGERATWTSGFAS